MLIAEPTAQVVTSLTKLYKDKGINIKQEVPKDLLFYGDQGDWMELIGNLLDNACKWAESSVRVVISKYTLGDGSSSRSGVLLVVEDDGPGIEEEIKKTILERGVRLDSQTPGHGIGLHIVKGIVEAYEGKIDIDNLSPGTRFSVELA